MRRTVWTAAISLALATVGCGVMGERYEADAGASAASAVCAGCNSEACSCAHCAGAEGVECTCPG